MGIYDKWKKEIEEKLNKLDDRERIEKIPAIIKRCPKCSHLTLEYDPKTGRIRCSYCGFEEYIPMMG